jgi:hypothetical protein
VATAQTIQKALHEAFDRFLAVYAERGGHRYHGWVDYDDPANYLGPTFWTEHDCVYRLALELERDFAGYVHLEMPVARSTFADFDSADGPRQRIDLVVSDLGDFVESDTSHQRFTTHEHDLFAEAKLFPAGCSKRWRADHVRKIPDVAADATRLARHIEKGHCRVAAILVVDDDNLFEDHRHELAWPEGVELLVASPRELVRRRAARA